MTEQRFTAATADEMRAIGEMLSAVLKAGDLVVLVGELGSGKTTLAQGIGVGLNVNGRVTSPTFVISRVHESLCQGPDLVHVDAYRLGRPSDVDDLDLDSSLPSAVTVVEWGEGLVEQLSDSVITVHITRDEHPRMVRIVGASHVATHASVADGDASA